jgi:hypothetical protein
MNLETLRIITEEANLWKSTPYVYGLSKMGKGTDCTRYVLNLLTVAKIIPPSRLQPQLLAKKYGGRMPAIKATLDLEPVKKPKFGNLVIIDDSLGCPHLGMLLEDGLTHSVEPYGVILGDKTIYPNTSYYNVLGFLPGGLLQPI